jgi:hypothetical protein
MSYLLSRLHSLLFSSAPNFIQEEGQDETGSETGSGGISGSTEADQPIVVPFLTLVPGDFELAGADVGVGHRINRSCLTGVRMRWMAAFLSFP